MCNNLHSDQARLLIAKLAGMCVFFIRKEYMSVDLAIMGPQYLIWIVDSDCLGRFCVLY